MLALPISTGIAGFFPAISMFFLIWLFMLSSGLLLLEANLWIGPGYSIISMANKTLGGAGKYVAWSTFLFLFYSLMVAFISASGSLFIQASGFAMQDWVGSLICVIVFAFLLFFGTRAVDHFNKLLVFGLVVSYIAILNLGIPHVEPELLKTTNWGSAPFILPAVFVSFGFHQLVPTLTTYLGGEVKSLKFSLIVGSALPLLIYFVWEAIVLGIVPERELQLALCKGLSATQALTPSVGPALNLASLSFAIFALTSTVITVALGFVDFLSDGLGIKKNKRGRLFLIALVLLPPFSFSLVNPHLFLKAINYAGAYGVSILFGILPALMVWVIRYRYRSQSPRCLPGGQAMLIFIMILSILMMVLETLLELGILCRQAVY